MCLLSKSNLFVTTLVAIPCLTIVISICNHIGNYILKIQILIIHATIILDYHKFNENIDKK